MSQLLDNTKKIDKKSRKRNRKLFLAQNCLKRIMSQLSDFLNFWHQIVIADLVPRSRSLKHCDAFKMLYFDKLSSMCSIGSKAET